MKQGRIWMETIATDQVKSRKYNLYKYVTLALYVWLLVKTGQKSRKLFHG